MKWVVRVVFAVYMSVSASLSAYAATTTSPTIPFKTASPFVISAFSFTGTTVRYVQIFNNSSSLASLDGWKVQSTVKATPTNQTQSLLELSGVMAPKSHVIAALPTLFDKQAFSLPQLAHSSTQTVASVSLVAPPTSGYLDEILDSPSISTTTTPKETIDGSAIYHVKRPPSTSTGNTYLSSSVAYHASAGVMMSDALYIAPVESSVNLEIVEIYSGAPVCSPFDSKTICHDYVKLRNTSASPIDIAKYRLRTGSYGTTATSSNTIQLSGIVRSGGYTIVPLNLSSTGSSVWLEDQYGSIQYQSTVVTYPSTTGQDNHAWSYDASDGAWKWTPFLTPSDTDNKFPDKLSVNSCAGLVITEVAANVASEDQFIELRNDSATTLDITGCTLQTNRSATTNYILAKNILEPNELMTVYIKDTPLTLTKTTTGTVYIMSSDFVTEADQVSYANLKADTSWSLVEGVWRQSYAITPGVANEWLEYPSCDEGYERNESTGLCNKVNAAETMADCGPGKYRSLETNRCRTNETIATLAACEEGKVRNTQTNRCRSATGASSLLTPCASNQVRNPVTNRCRGATATTASLKPCDANQVRNPATNRCRLASGGSTGLKPCASGQERNPTTNRCRKMAGGATADFPVEAVAESGQATVGWWAFGGVGVLAVGYAGWEWRREVSGIIKRFLPFGIGRS